VFPAYPAALAPYSALTDTTTQSSAFLPIPGQCNCAFPMSFRHLQGHLLYVNPKPPTFLSIHQLFQAAAADLVTYLMMTAEVGLPDAV